MRTLSVRQTPGPILIISPHPDDDILGSGGLIQQALALGKRVYVIFVTTGDANGESVIDYLHRKPVPSSFIDLGYVRHREAVKAEHFLGVPESHLFFLGFPDGDMYEIATDSNYFQVHRSPTTHLTRAVYPFAYLRNVAYTHGEAVRLISDILWKVHPNTVVVNLEIDIHPDHQAARILTLEAIRRVRIHPQIYSYLIHYPNWPRKARGPLLPPKGVDIPGLVSLPLTRDQERKTREAYNIHRSQSSLIPNNYNLIRPNELFWINSPKHLTHGGSRRHPVTSAE